VIEQDWKLLSAEMSVDGSWIAAFLYLSLVC
jgi:hypothetical protein